MKALIAFVIMAVIVLSLIEVNERIKTKCRNTEKTSSDAQPLTQTTNTEDCNEACNECGLLDVCEKEKKR